MSRLESTNTFGASLVSNRGDPKKSTSGANWPQVNGLYKVYKLLSTTSLPKNRLNTSLQIGRMEDVVVGVETVCSFLHRPDKAELERLYKKGVSLRQLGRIFNVSPGTIRRLMVEYKIMVRNRFWTRDEIIALKELYPKGEKRALATRIQDRTWSSILAKTSELGLKSPKPECKLAREELEKLYRQTNVDQVASALNISLPTLYRWLTKAHITLKGFEKHPCLIPSPELVYILGVLRGDGFTCVIKKRWHYSVRLRTISKKFAESFANALRKIGLNPHISMEYPPIGSNRRPVHVVIACSKRFVAWYRGLDDDEIRKIVGKNKELAVAFVRGFYESEGSYFLKTDGCDRIAIYNTQLHLLLMVRDFSLQLGHNMNLRKGGKTRKGNQVYILWKDGRKARTIIGAICPSIKNRPSNGQAAKGENKCLLL